MISEKNNASPIVTFCFTETNIYISLYGPTSVILSIESAVLHCRYPLNEPREGCWGDGSPGVISYGEKERDETYDVYCFAENMPGTPLC